MNNKGFTLIEVLAVVVVISLVLVFVVRNFGETVSISKEQAYQLMKNNVLESANHYILECNSKTIACDYMEEHMQFNASFLIEKGFFQSLISPIDGKELGDCLVISVDKINGNYQSSLIDNCY